MAKNENFITENNSKIHKNEKVFYNPAQKFNRDLTTSVLNMFLKDKKSPAIFEAMSATGLRGIRFIKELECECDIYLNDSDSRAINAIKQNFDLNNIKLISIDNPENIKPYNNNVEIPLKNKLDNVDSLSNSNLNNVDSLSKNNLNNLEILSNNNLNNIDSLLNNSLNSIDSLSKNNLNNLEILSNNNLNNIDSLSKNNKNPQYNYPETFIYENKTIKLVQSDCNAYLYQNRNKFDVIDIDPFGSCTTFIDSALSNIRNNGLLCLTSTDTSVMCSNKRKCFIKYNCLISKTPACHEQSLRVLLGYVSMQAGKYEKSIDPILSVSIDFYVRVFVIVRNKNFKKMIDDNSYYSICSCFNHLEHKIFSGNKNLRIEKTECECCGGKFSVFGPFYNKILCDKFFVKELIEREMDNRVRGVLKLINNEIDTFLFYCIPELCRKMKTPCVPIIRLASALFKKGYKVSLTHCKLNSIKTDCPINIIYELIKNFFKIINTEDFSIFDVVEEIEIAFKDNYYRDLVFSNLGPLSRPKH